jgi:hypothetical protein
MDVQLRHLISQSSDVDLCRAADFLQALRGTRELFYQQFPVGPGEIEELEEIWAARHEYEPRISAIVHQLQARQRPIGHENSVGGEARVKREFSHAASSLAERDIAVSPDA